jgi:hypothetical protein
MNIVNESNLGGIKSVFNDNASNSHYYKIINKTFHGIIKNLEFAKPIIQVNQGSIIWQSISPGPYLNYTNLDRENKDYIDSLIKESLNEMSSIMEKNTNKDFLEDIIEVPSEGSIFYTRDSDNDVNIILTEWGFVKDEHLKREGVLKKIFSTSMKSFIVKFKSNKNELLEGVNTSISSEDLNFQATSNVDGLVKINNLKKGNTIVVSSVDGSFEDVNLKVDEKDEYIIIVNRNFTLYFTVIDSNNKPVSNCEFLFKSDIYKNKYFSTDLVGNYDFQHPESEGGFQVFSNENNELLFEMLPSEDQQYTIIYDPPIEEPKDNSMKNVEEPIIEKSIELEFLNWRRKPIVKKEIDLYGQNGKSNYITDEDGIIYLDTLNRDIEYGIFMNFKNASWKTEFKHTDKSRYTFIVKKKRFLWWWVPFFLFFLCLLLIPTQVAHQYTVLDKNSKQPVALAEVSSAEISKYQVQSFQDQTDSLGNLYIKYGKYQLFKQIFKSPSTDIFVSKSGYESLKAKVPLSYFKTDESIIYLNQFKVRNVPIEDCNSRGDAHNAGGNSVKEFDLIKNKGAFVFTYNTGDTHADIIRIYDCSKFDINNKQPIWSIDEASGGDKSLTIGFTSQIITVEVIGGGNLQSIWKYHVKCPI